jgi:uncharacterized surface protein with fasciclin (FAS1) repeats
MDKSNNKSAFIAIALIVGLALGGGLGYAAAASKDEPTTQANSSMTKTAAGDGVTVGGARMVREKDIVDNAVEASNVTTVVSLVKLAGLVDTLKSEGPFTVFAPNNGAFEKLDAATVESLQQPENVDALKNILTYHVVAGTYTSADLKAMAQKGETIMSVQGEMLTPILEDNMIKIQDASGNKVDIETADVISSNGVTHVITSVMMPKN